MKLDQQNDESQVDGFFRTSNPRVYAVGDVTGPPGLASSAQMGGRAVASYLFKDKMLRLQQYMLETSTDLEVRRRRCWWEQEGRGKKGDSNWSGMF